MRRGKVRVASCVYRKRVNRGLSYHNIYSPTSVCHLEMRRCRLGTQALLDQLQVEALLVLQGAEHERIDCRKRHSIYQRTK